jgi:hypothetical protein
MTTCPEQICKLISCPVTDDIPSYSGAYSLQNGLSFTNLLISVPSPLYPGGYYYVQPGAITINVPPGATSVSHQGCQSTVTQAIPSGSTSSQIQAIAAQLMQAIAAQSAVCNAPANPHNPVPSPLPPVVFWNQIAFVSCPNGLLMNLVGTLPPVVIFGIQGLSIVAGVFSSTVSQADADAKADAFLQSFIGGAVVCGWWNTEQSYTCDDSSVQTIPADTYFSTVSQADADAQALAAAMAECFDCGGNPTTIGGVAWSIDRSWDSNGFFSATADGQTGGAFIFSGSSPTFGGTIFAIFNFCNPTNSDIILHLTPTAAYGGSGNAGIGDSDNMFRVIGGVVHTPATEADITIPAMSTDYFVIEISSQNNSFSGMITIS